MADRNEVFRIILEGRDRLSKELDGVRRSADKLDESLKRLKRNKPDDFPLFGGGRATRGPGGQFIRKEDVTLVDRMRQSVDNLNKSIAILKRNKPQEFPLFGGGRAVRGDDGRFIRVQDVTLLEKAKNRLDAIDKALVRIRTRIRRGPLVEGEEAGAGATRLIRNEAGQFVRAADIGLLRRLGREFAPIRAGIREIQRDTRNGLILGVAKSVDDLKKVRNFVDQVGTKIRDALTGGGKTRTGVDPTTARFISVQDINAFQKFVNLVTSGANKMVAANDKVAESQRRVNREILNGFKVGFSASKETERIIDERVAKSREEVNQRRIDLQKQQELERVALSAREDRTRKEVFRRLELLREEGALEIEELRRQRAKLGKTEDDLDEKDAISARIREIQRERRLRESQVRADLGAKFQARRAQQRIEFAGQRRAISAPDVEEIEKLAAEARKKAIDSAETSFGRLGRRAGLAFGDIVRGAKSARSGLRDMDKDVRLVNNAFTRFGFAVGSVFRRFDQLVNLRWLFLTGILTTFFTLIVQIGTALVALAASAIQAGAAIGGAFLSGIAEALPVVGLLAAAFSQFNKVLDAVKLNEKLGKKVKDNVDQIKEAGQRLADAQYNLKRAVEAVGEAHRGVIEANKDLKDSYKDVRDATKNLAEAKIQAARDIVDANLEEKDSALSLQEAELGVLEAKQRLREEQEKQRKGAGDADEARAALREAQDRLRIAKEQGDASEISAAQQQVTLAEQNLNAILDQVDSAKTDLKDAELGVKRANLTVEQARVRNNRAQQDAKKARNEGVKGSDVVKSAQDQLKNAIEAVSNAQHSVLLANRNVRDSLHQVAIAQREVADARREETNAKKGQSQADKDAQKAFADLSPAEKKLFASLKRIRKVFQDVFIGNNKRDGILGPITESIARFVDNLTEILLDPKIQKAATTLAGALANAIDRIGKFVSSRDFKDALVFFTERAAANLPAVVTGILNIAQAFLNIAKAADPIFTRLLRGAVGLTGRFKDLTSQRGEVRRPEEGGPGAGVATLNPSGLDKFLSSAETHLDAWLKLSGAIIKLIVAITDSPASGAGTTLIGDLTDQIERLTNFIKDNPEEVQKFFDNAIVSIENLSKVLGRLTGALIKSFSSKEFSDFVRVVSEIIVPGLLLFIFVLGKLSQGLITLLDIPVIGDLVKWAATFLVAEKAMNKVFPVTQKLTEAFKKLAVGIAREFSKRGFKGIFDDVRLRMLYLVDAFKKGFKAIGDAATATGKTIVGAMTKAKDAVAKLGTSLLDVAKNAASRAANAFSKVSDAVLGMITRMRIAATLMAGRLFAAIRGLATLIYTRLLGALLALRISIRLLVSATVIGALITAGILLIQNWDKVKKYAKILADFLVEKFKAVVSWFRENWKKVLVGILLLPFAPAGLLILGILKFKDRILGIFGDIKQGIIDRFKAAIDWIKEKVTALGGWVSKTLKKLPLVGRFFGKGGEADDKPPIIAATPEDIRAAERTVTHRATGGIIPGKGSGDTVPAMLTPGEWVLNNAQQDRLARALGITVTQAKAILFGTKSNSPPLPAGASRGTPGFRGIGRVGGNAPFPHGAQVGASPQKVINFADFNLVSQDDEDGNTIWFIQQADGTFGQVTARDATKIQASHGTWIPGYVKRSSHGYKQVIETVRNMGRNKYNFGGIVTSPGVQRFAEGGIVQAPGNGGTSRGGNTVNQNFSVRTEGETDWGYVMRLGAIHAQESF